MLTYIEEQLTCRLPWARQREHSKLTHASLPLCSTHAQFKGFLNVTQAFLQITEKGLKELTGCLPRCDSERYVGQLKMDGHLPNNPSLLAAKGDLK